MSDWISKPNGCWDIRSSGKADPRAIFPPLKCLVLNGQNERIKDVFFVDFDSERVGVWKNKIGVDGYEVKEFTTDSTGVRHLVEEWFDCPGVHIIPFPPGYEEMVAKENQEKKKKITKYSSNENGEVTEIQNVQPQ